MSGQLAVEMAVALLAHGLSWPNTTNHVCCEGLCAQGPTVEKCFPKVKFVKMIGHTGKIKCTIDVFTPQLKQFEAYLWRVNLKKLLGNYITMTVWTTNLAVILLMKEIMHQLRDSSPRNVQKIHFLHQRRVGNISEFPRYNGSTGTAGESSLAEFKPSKNRSEHVDPVPWLYVCLLR